VALSAVAEEEQSAAAMGIPGRPLLVSPQRFVGEHSLASNRISGRSWPANAPRSLHGVRAGAPHHLDRDGGRRARRVPAAPQPEPDPPEVRIGVGVSTSLRCNGTLFPRWPRVRSTYVAGKMLSVPPPRLSGGSRRRARLLRLPAAEPVFQVRSSSPHYDFGNGSDRGAGALLQLGPSYGKFGSAKAGGSRMWTGTRFAF